jgi:hypothetical protein
MSAENKTQPTEASVDAFIDAIEDPRRREDCRAMLPMLERITGEKPRMWGPSIVGFGRYHYKYPSGREGDAILAGFSPRKGDLTVYVNSGFGPFADQLAQLGKHKSSVSCLYLKRLADVDVAVLEQILAESVRLTRLSHPA